MQSLLSSGISFVVRNGDSTVAQAPPGPAYILRGHSASVSVLQFSHCGQYLFSGDTDGWVAVWNLRTFRPRHFWRAHVAGILSIEELDAGLLTQGRDNKLHLYQFRDRSIEEQGPPIDHGAATAVPSPAAPSTGVSCLWSLDINAMNFCRMSLCSLDPASRKGKEHAAVASNEALIAVPSLTKDDFVDVFHYPSRKRIHRSLGAGAFVGQKTGTVMATHLLQLPRTTARQTSPTSSAPDRDHASSADKTPKAEQAPGALHLLIAYESGQVALFRFSPTSSFERRPFASSSVPTSAPEPALYDSPRDGIAISESEGWDLVWFEKGHRDAVMSLAVTDDQHFAYTVGADHHLVAYRIDDRNDTEASLPRSHTELTASAGKSCVAVRQDGKILVTAGWDGETRVYQCKTLQPLAVLSHHRTSLQAVAFAPLWPEVSSHSFRDGHNVGEEEEDEGDDDDIGEKESDTGRTRMGRAWLATGGQEAKIALWEVYPPKTGATKRKAG